MKRKLKQIVVEDTNYLYTMKDQYLWGKNKLTVRIFLDGSKSTPLIVEFLTIDDYYMGQLLKTGVYLRNENTQTKEQVNLNRPKFIRDLILEGIQQGWNGTNRIGIQDGLTYLKKLGYDINSLLAE